jgi:catechol 2,3-dioxygenase-like lactoylglutathione lyase family enzyme
VAKIMRIHHAAVTVPTEGLEEARGFYSGVLGLEEAPRPEAELGRPGIWYHLGETELHIQCRDGGPPAGADYHPALIVDDLAALKAHLSRSGVTLREAPTLMGRERFFCYDPFGNLIELMSLPD